MASPLPMALPALLALLLMLAPLAARASACGIDRGPRRNERPSDHAPVWVTLR